MRHLIETGAQLKAVREGLGLTQADAAARYGASPRSWQSWEAAEQCPQSAATAAIQWRLFADELRALFSFREAICVADALRSWIYTLEDYKHAWMSIEDYLQDEANVQRWGIEHPARLVARIRTLGPSGTMAILDAVSRYYERSDEHPWMGLYAVGLTTDAPDVDLIESLEGPDWGPGV